MSPVIAPPSPPAPGTAEALFAQARRRRRRRRLTALVVILALAASAAVAVTVTRPHRARVARGVGGVRAGTAGFALAGSVAWVDYYGRVHLGNLASLAQQVVATTNADPALPLAQVGGRLYWVNWSGADVPGLGHRRYVVQELDPATGTIRFVAPGKWVFPSADGRHLFISVTDTRLLELPAGGAGPPRALTLPRGWYVPDGVSFGVAGGVLVQPGYKPGARTRFAVWSPNTGAVKVIGKGIGILAAYTPPGGRDGLLAWLPVACAEGQNCPLKITNTATLATRTVRSPLRHGFAPSGAFSPDGTQLAVFPDTSPDAMSAVRLAMVSTGTGALRLSGSVRLAAGCPAAWVLWLPDGRHLITGGIQTSYVVNAATLSARPFFFIGGGPHDIEASQDINYSAAVVPPRR